MFDTWSKNNEQKCWADLHTRFHPGSFSSDLSFLVIRSTSKKRNRGSAFLMMRYGKGAGNTDKGKTFFKTHLPYKDPLQHNHRTKRKKKRNRKYGHVIYTAFTHLSRP